MQLSPTYGNFTLIGRVIGTKTNLFFSSGQNKSKDEWRRIKFGIRTKNNITVFSESVAIKGKTEGKIKVNINKTGLKIDILSVSSYDGLELLHEHLKDGDLVYVRGNIQFNEYQKQIKPNFMFHEVLKIDEEDFTIHSGASFKQECVYIGFDESENKVKTKIITKNGEGFKFFDYDFEIGNMGLIEHICNLPYGSVIELTGDIEHRVLTEETEDGPIACGIKKEFIVKGFNINENKMYGKNDLTDLSDRFIIRKQSEEDERGF